ncbi:MAG: serine/threonine-protein kinase [Anaerolineae bacterium]
MDLAIGAVLDNYTVIRVIGAGSMGAVYEAIEERTGNHVAIKMLHPDRSDDTGMAARFDREILVMRSLDHPHIVRCLGYGEHQGKTYFVMALVAGVSLAVWIRSHFFTPLEVLAILEPLCSALDYAHSFNVLHRDVKPSNILVDLSGENPQVYLSDFGLSKVIDMASLTETQMQVGTPNYMSPEQAQDFPLTPATDVYALAIIAYEMLLRQLPFVAHDDFEMAMAQVQQPPRAPSELVTHFPLALELVLLKGLAKDPDYRYASAGQFYTAFAEAVTELDEEARSTIYRYA